MPLRIVHYYRDLTRPSGVTAAIAGWQSAAISMGIETIAYHNSDPGDWPMPHKVIPHIGSGRQRQVPRLFDLLAAGDLLVLHEGWITSNYVAAWQARRKGIPYIVMPHGVYEPDVQRGLKGRSIRLALGERRYLASACAVHVFYESEIALAAAIAPLRVTFVLPTGITAPDVRWTGGGGYLAWFGRYDVEHKGIDRMLQAYARIDPSDRLPLKLRGIDYFGGKALVEELIKYLDLEKFVALGGPLSNEEKYEFLAQSEAFLFPSRWESQGIALVEALAIGVPCVVSDSIHMAASLRNAKAAIVVEFNDVDIAADAMVKVASDVDLSMTAVTYVDRNLSWKGLGEKYFDKVSQLGS